MKSFIVPVLALLALAGCRSTDSTASAKPRGLAGTLAGEWVAVGQSDEYLMFRPDEGEPKTGRFSGWGRFDRYQIKTGLSLGSQGQVALSSAAEESELAIGVNVSGDGRSLVVQIPAGTAKGAVVRTYRKAK